MKWLKWDRDRSFQSRSWSLRGVGSAVIGNAPHGSNDEITTVFVVNKTLNMSLYQLNACQNGFSSPAYLATVTAGATK